MTDVYKNENKRLCVDVMCDCGNSKTVLFQSLENGSTQSCGCLNKEILSAIRGELHHNWNPNLTDEEREKSHRREEITGYREFKKNVLERDNYTCRICGTKRLKNMRVHHLNGWSIDERNRLNVNNAITLCPECHDIQYEGSYHNVYGNKESTIDKFIEYINCRLKDEKKVKDVLFKELQENKKYLKTVRN